MHSYPTSFEIMNVTNLVQSITWMVIVAIGAVALLILFFLNAGIIQTARLSVIRKVITTLEDPSRQVTT